MGARRRDTYGVLTNHLKIVWNNGYSVAELWGFTKPVSRGDSANHKIHLILWGILNVVEYQVDHGAGHKYLRARLWKGDWKAIGFLAPKTPQSELVIVPPIVDAKFGWKQSELGNSQVRYTDVRIVHSTLFSSITLSAVTGSKEADQCLSCSGNEYTLNGPSKQL